MNGPFTFAEASEEYLDFLREKRRQVIGLILVSVASGVLAAGIVAEIRGDALEAVVPAVQTMAALLIFSAVGLGAYGYTQGGSRRDL